MAANLLRGGGFNDSLGSKVADDDEAAASIANGLLWVELEATCLKLVPNGDVDVDLVPAACLLLIENVEEVELHNE